MNLHVLRKKSCAFIAALGITGTAYAQTSNINEGVIRVKVRPTLSEGLTQESFKVKNGIVQTGVTQLDAVASKVKAYSMERVFPHNPKNEARHAKHGLDRWYEIKFNTTTPTTAVLSYYQDIPDIEIAEPSQIVELIGNTKPIRVVTAAELANDPYFARQWHYHNEGSNPNAIAGSDINLLEAWKVTMGSPNVIVSVVDGGIDVAHNDLKANLWINEAEQNGTPGIDDDGNGYIDDIYGYNFVTQNATISPHTHGTHVAGTVGAVNNNNLGVSGVAGGSREGEGVRLMSCQIFTESGQSGQYAQAIVYGADNGAVISQNSWGYQTEGAYEQLVLDAIDYFAEEAGQYEGAPMKGGVVIFASGNNGAEGLYYPACYSSCISVSAIGPCFKATSYTNYGDWVSLSAPGGESGYGSAWSVFSTYTDNKYAYMDGTSMACPHVSGIAALIVSKYGDGKLTAADVKQRLLTGTHNLDTYNPDYIGKMGSGYIDAALSLKSDNGEAPATVADLNLTGMAQDFAQLNWTASADGDDGQAYKYVLYHSKSAFDAATAAKAQQTEIPVKDVAAGSRIDYTLENLEPTTVYYFAVQAFDRWGHASALSSVISGITNAGPEVALSGNILSLTAEVTTNAAPEGTFELINNGEGMLNWNAFIRHSSQQYTTPYQNTGKPIVPHLSVIKSSVGSSRLEKASESVSVSSDINEYKTISYGESLYYVIGETDTTKTQVTATYFYTATDFNLTSLNIMLKHNNASGPFKVQIMNGNKYDPANIIYEQEYNSFSSQAYSHNLTLSDQLYFPAGSAFWVNIVMPSGNLYPFGIATETGQYYYSDYCFYSSDGGKTLQTLESIVKGGLSNPELYVWDIELVSSNGWFGNYLTLSNDNGKLSGKSKEEILIKSDAAALIDGTYKANVVINTNDPKNKEIRQPVSLEVSGHQPILQTTKVVNFNDVFIGESKIIEIEVVNSGLCAYANATTSISNPSFKITSPLYSLNGQSKGKIQVRFTPEKEGSQSALITMKSTRGYTYQFSVCGIGVSAGKLTLTPDTVRLPDAAVDAALEQTVTIAMKNEGNYPLEFAFGNFTESLPEKLSELNVNRFGYKISHNKQGGSLEFEWDDISTEATDIRSELTSLNQYYKVGLGFNFPCYGAEYDSLYITYSGMLVNADQNNLLACMPPAPGSSCLNDIIAISCFGYPIKIGSQSHVYYKSENDRFIVTYENVSLASASGTLTAQIILHVNGDVEFRYLDIAEEMQSNTSDFFVGITDLQDLDPVIVNSAEYPFDPDNDSWTFDIASNTAFYLAAPGASVVKEASLPSGLLQIDEETTCELKLNVQNLSEGRFSQNVAIITSNPTQPVSYLHITGNITGGGTPQLQMITASDIELGKVFRTQPLKGVILLNNNGTSTAQVKAAATGKHLTLREKDLAFAVDPKHGYQIGYTCATDKAGIFNDTVTITSGDISYTANIHYEIVAEPVFNSDTKMIEATIAGGTTQQKQVIVENKGDSEMQIALINSSLAYMQIDKQKEDETISYQVMRNDESELPAYKWEDRHNEAHHFAPTTFTNINNVSVELPFAFNFYGKEYTKMYIHMSGMLSFQPYPEEDDNQGFLIPFPLLGTNDRYNNIIAPMFGLHVPNFMDDPAITGIFYYQADDYVLVEWANYFDIYGIAQTYSFQAHLYKNGNIKFQYKNAERSYWTYYSVGLENSDASQNIVITNGDRILRENMAITLSPFKKETIGANSSKTFDITLDAKTLNAGTYNSELLFQTDAPLTPEYSIPVELTVTGEAKPAIPEKVDFGIQMITWRDAVVDPSETDPYAAFPHRQFDLRNDGFADMQITGLSSANSESNIFGFLVKVKVNGWGGSYETFIPVDAIADYGFSEITVPAGSKATFKIVLLATESRMYEDTLFINSTAGNFAVPTKASLIEPPYASVEAADMNVIARGENFTIERSITLSNGTQGSDLSYKTFMQFDRQVSGASVSYKTPATANTAVKLAGMDSAMSMPSDGIATRFASLRNIRPTEAPEGYNRAITHFENENAVTALGFGTSAAMSVAVRYKAPVDGFNLTHVRTWYSAGTMNLSTVHAYILAGASMPGDCAVIGHGKLVVETTESETLGSQRTVALDAPIHLYPEEEFFIMLAYELGVGFPQGCGMVASYVDIVSDRYYYQSGSQWYDLSTNESFSTATFLVSGLEKTADENYWIELKSDKGSVAAGASASIRVLFNDNYSQGAINSGTLNIVTNDPANDTIRIPVSMRVNQAPVINLKKTSYHVSEMETLEIPFDVTDGEGDEFTVAAELPDFIKLSGNDGNYKLTITPGYTHQGIYTVTLSAKDISDKSADKALTIEVNNVNRNPASIAMAPITIRENELSGEYILDNYFQDPDNDALVYSVDNRTPSVVKVFLADNSLMVYGVKAGTGEVHITATDPSKASVKNVLSVTVNSGTGLNGTSVNGLSIMPNPVVSVAYITLNERYSGMVAYQILNNAGSTLMSGSFDVANAEINVESLPSGVYYILLKSNDRNDVLKMMKE